MAEALRDGNLEIVPRNLIQTGTQDSSSNYDAISNLVNLIVLKQFGENFGTNVSPIKTSTKEPTINKEEKSTNVDEFSSNEEDFIMNISSVEDISHKESSKTSSKNKNK